jgi:hypothetical protein
MRKSLHWFDNDYSLPLLDRCLAKESRDPIYFSSTGTASPRLTIPSRRKRWIDVSLDIMDGVKDYHPRFIGNLESLKVAI